MKGFLKQLSCCNKKSLPGIIKHACKKDLRRFINFTMEVMRKHVKVSPELARLIKQNRHVLRHIVHPLYSLKSKKQYLIQHGVGKLAGLLGILVDTWDLPEQQTLAQWVEHLKACVCGRGLLAWHEGSWKV